VLGQREPRTLPVVPQGRYRGSNIRLGMTRELKLATGLDSDRAAANDGADNLGDLLDARPGHGLRNSLQIDEVGLDLESDRADFRIREGGLARECMGGF
jgi:hypothetical protein